jgi:hypothetical protein
VISLNSYYSMMTVAFSPSGEFTVSGGDQKVSTWSAPWWDDNRKQVITTFVYLPPSVLMLFVTAATRVLPRRVSSPNV